MIRLDKDYSDYVDETDEKYPAGKAVNASSSESYDGTPWLDTMMNDIHGARQAIFKKAYGSVNGLSGEPDNADESDILNAIKKLIDDPDNAHAALRGTDAHGATVEASPGQIVTRDEFGRAKVAAPLEDDDIARKSEVDDAETRAKNLANATGVLAIEKGGTGATSQGEINKNIANVVPADDSDPADGSLFVMRVISPSNTSHFYTRTGTRIWNYIKSKISSVLGLTSTSYGGKAATAGTADTAKACTGNSATATKATNDSKSQAITSYIRGLSISGKIITYTKGDGTTGTLTTQDTNTTYSNATQSAAGLMSASDKTKLDGLRSSPIIYPTSIKLSSAVSLSSNKSITDSTAVSTVYIATSTARTITNNSSGPLSIMEIKGISGTAASGVTVPGVLYGTPCTEGEISVSGSSTKTFILPPGQSRSYSISGSNLYIAVFRN